MNAEISGLRKFLKTRIGPISNAGGNLDSKPARNRKN